MCCIWRYQSLILVTVSSSGWIFCRFLDCWTEDCTVLHEHDYECTSWVNKTVPVDVDDVPVVNVSFFHRLICLTCAYTQCKNIHLPERQITALILDNWENEPRSDHKQWLQLATVRQKQRNLPNILFLNIFLLFSVSLLSFSDILQFCRFFPIHVQVFYYH